jgi:hypothetical protein
LITQSLLTIIEHAAIANKSGKRTWVYFETSNFFYPFINATSGKNLYRFFSQSYLFGIIPTAILSDVSLFMQSKFGKSIADCCGMIRLFKIHDDDLLPATELIPNMAACLLALNGNGPLNYGTSVMYIKNTNEIHPIVNQNMPLYHIGRRGE